MFTTLALVRQRLAVIRAAVDELADLAAAAETAGAALLPLETQSRLLLDLDRIGERLEEIGEEISGAVDPGVVRPEAPAEDAT